MKLIASHKINRFGGIDNVNLPTDMEQIDDTGHTYYFQSMNNFDITNKRTIQRRNGFHVIHSFDSLHSLWSDGNNCFFMNQNSIYKLNQDMTYTVLSSGFGPRRMNYAAAYNKIYFTNETEIGYIEENTVISLSLPSDSFKLSMPPGHLIEFYNHCLYVAVGNIVYCSDPTVLSQYDERYGLIPFKQRITMLKAVDDGLWISDANNIYFLSGNNITDFSVSVKTDYGVKERSAIEIDNTFVGIDAVGKSVVMLTNHGIVIGSNGGQFLIPTQNHYHGSDFFVVYDAFIEKTDNIYQYLIMGYDYQSGEPFELLAGLQILQTTSELNHIWALPFLQLKLTATFL